MTTNAARGSLPSGKTVVPFPFFFSMSTVPASASSQPMKPIKHEDLPDSIRRQITKDGKPILVLDAFNNKPRPSARARSHTPGKMNETESAYARELARRQLEEGVSDFLFEGVSLEIGNRCWYTPDFLVIYRDGSIDFAEVKAWWNPSKAKAAAGEKGKVGWREDARIKIKAAAARFPWFRFVATWMEPGKPGWQIEEFSP